MKRPLINLTPIQHVPLRRRLVVVLLGLTLISWLISVIVTAINAQYLIYHQIDRQLEEYMGISSFTLNMVMSTPSVRDYFRAQNPPHWESAKVVRVPGYGSQGTDNATNVWFKEEHILVGANTPQFPKPISEGFHQALLNTSEGESEWRILYRYQPQYDNWIAVGFNMDRAEKITSTTWHRVMLPLLIILPLSIGVLLLGIRRGLAPLNALAERISARSAFDLEPIGEESVPTELQPLIHALNQLMARLQSTLSSEQRFTANAAHELQTPLTAIKAEVQRYQRQVDDESARHMLEQIGSRVDRATNTVKQLLTLARLDPDQEVELGEVDLQRLLLEALAEHGAEAIDRGLELNLSEPQRAVFIRGHADWLNMLLHNLLLNALRHTESQGRLEIALLDDNDAVVLSIANDARHISDEELEQLTTRFYRGNNPVANGSGLGLSIVKRIAQLHQASLHLSRWEKNRGFQAIVHFERQRQS